MRNSKVNLSIRKVCVLFLMFNLFSSMDSYSQFVEDYFINYDIKLSSKEWRKENQIKSIQINYQKVSNDEVSDKITPGNIYEFDENGSLIHRTFRDGKHDCLLEYDQDHRLVRETIKKKNKVMVEHSLNYNSFNKISDETWISNAKPRNAFSDQRAIYQYDDSGKLIEVMIVGPKNQREIKRQRFVYSESDRLEEILFCLKGMNTTSAMAKDFTKLDCSNSVKFIYDDNGLLLEERIFGPSQSQGSYVPGGGLYFTLQYEYDEEKRILKKTLTESNNIPLVFSTMIEPIQLVQYAYRFDFKSETSFKSRYFSDTEYRFPFDAFFYDGHYNTYGHEAMQYHFSGKEFSLSYKEGQISMTTLTNPEKRIQEMYNFTFGSDNVLKEIVVLRANSETFQLEKQEVITIVINKY